MQVGIRALKLHLSRYLACVRRGESLVVTDRGKPIARLEPILNEELPPRIRELIAAGRLIYKGPPRHLPTPIPMLLGDKTSLDYVREQRRRTSTLRRADW